MNCGYGYLNFYFQAKLECRLFGGLGFDLVALGWFQAARVGDDSHSTRFDINSALTFLMAVRFDLLSVVFRHCLDECKVPVFYT